MPQMGWFDKRTAAAANEELVLMSLGVYAAPKRRDATLPKAMVAEIYSPLRFTEEFRRRPWTWRSLIPGFAFDL